MKRNLLLKGLKENNCVLHREGSDHSIFINLSNGKKAPVPRHADIIEVIVFRICKQLGIPKIR